MESLLADLKARDRERYLSILWAPAEARPALIAIHAYDLEQMRVVAEARESMLAEIRLAWWREQLELLSGGRLAPPQPLLRALRQEARPRGVDLGALSQIEDAFLPLLTEGALDPLAMAEGRGRPLFQALATACLGRPLSNGQAESAARAGMRWALAQLWRGGWGQAEVRLSSLMPPALPPAPEGRLPLPLLLLDLLARDDFARLGAGKPLSRRAGPARQWRMALAAFRRHSS
jgi:phytoene synthase